MGHRFVGTREERLAPPWLKPKNNYEKLPYHKEHDV